jgi:hypothetical protein
MRCNPCAEATAAAEFVVKETQKNEQKSRLRIIADEDTHSSVVSGRETKRQKAAKRQRIYLGVAIFGFLILAARLVTLYTSNTPLTNEEIRAQELARAQLSACVQVFWEIAAQLQNNQPPNDPLQCAEAGMPNIITRTGNDITVTHPRPELLGYKEIYVSKSNPVPILVEISP